MTELPQLYKDDFVAWTREQAEALRGFPRDRLPAALSRALDWNNLAEEIESLGGSQRLALSSQIRRIIHHLLKLEVSPAEGPRNIWRNSIREGRVAAASVLRQNPSLRRELRSMAVEEGAAAVRLALGDLDDHGELDAPTAGKVRARTFDLDAEILSDWMPERRRAD